MIPENTVFKSFLRPAISVINNVTYVVPGWHIVPEGTTLEEVSKHWVKEELLDKPEKKPTHKIYEHVKSSRTDEKYLVQFNGLFWSCTCAGYQFRGKCKHVDQIKTKYLVK